MRAAGVRQRGQAGRDVQPLPAARARRAPHARGGARVRVGAGLAGRGRPRRRQLPHRQRGHGERAARARPR